MLSYVPSSRIDAGPQALSSKSSNDSSFIQIFKLKPKGAAQAPAREGTNPASTSASTSAQASAQNAQRGAPVEDEDLEESAGAAGGDDGNEEDGGGLEGEWFVICVQ